MKQTRYIITYYGKAYRVSAMSCEEAKILVQAYLILMAMKYRETEGFVDESDALTNKAKEWFEEEWGKATGIKLEIPIPEECPRRSRR